MAIKNQKPPIKETVGAQYLCFATATTDGTFTATYETDVEKTEVVKSVTVKENSESTPISASGKLYRTESLTSSTEISVEVVAFMASTLAQMRGDKVDETTGLLLGGGDGNRPYFAYGKVVILSDGNYAYDWYPKCQLTANSDDIKTKEDKFSEQNDTLTISAMPFNDNNDIVVRISSNIKIPTGLTEDKFFSKPVLSVDDLKKVLAATVSSNPVSAG